MIDFCGATETIVQYDTKVTRINALLDELHELATIKICLNGDEADCHCTYFDGRELIFEGISSTEEIKLEE